MPVKGSLPAILQCESSSCVADQRTARTPPLGAGGIREGASPHQARTLPAGSASAIQLPGGASTIAAS